MSIPIDTTVSPDTTGLLKTLREMGDRVSYLLASDPMHLEECTSQTLFTPLRAALESLRNMAGAVSLAEMLATSGFARAALPVAHVSAPEQPTLGTETNPVQDRSVSSAERSDGDDPIIIAPEARLLAAAFVHSS